MTNRGKRDIFSMTEESYNTQADQFTFTGK